MIQKYRKNLFDLFITAVKCNGLFLTEKYKYLTDLRANNRQREVNRRVVGFEVM